LWVISCYGLMAQIQGIIVSSSYSHLSAQPT
jgi:hypothetical protein